MHFQVALLFMEHEGRAVPWQQKSLPVGCLFVEIMKEEETEGTRNSSCSFFVVGYWFWDFFLFVFVLMSHLHSVLDFYVKQKWPVQHMVWKCCWDPLAKPKVKMRQLQQGHLGPWGPQGAGDSEGSRSCPGRAALQDWHLDLAELSLRREVKPGERGLGHKGETWKLKGYSRTNYFAVLNH